MFEGSVSECRTQFAKGNDLKTVYGVEIPGSFEELVDPKRCALIVYDMQAGIVRQIEDGSTIIGRVKQVLDVARGEHAHLSHPPSFVAETVDGCIAIPDGNVMAATR